MPQGRPTTTSMWHHWLNTYRVLMPHERAEYARRREFDLRIGKTAARRLNTLLLFHGNLPGLERDDADKHARKALR